jgi:hypothetical protein
MPYTIRKVPKKNCYKVMNKRTRRVFSKCSTNANAKKQLRLLNAIEYNPNFVRRNTITKTTKRTSQGSQYKK